jgi:hypothetical protein
MPERMVTLLWFDKFEQAEYYREQLEDAGINSAVVDDREDSDELEDEFPQQITGLVRLMVTERDAEAAGQVLEERIDEMMGESGSPSIEG